MGNKIIFIIIAVLALIVQIVPSYWFAVGGSLFVFWNEGIFEGGIFSTNTGATSGADYFLAGIFSIYSIAAFIVPFLSFFLARKSNLDKEWSKKSITFLIINILTIILVLCFAVAYGIIPHL